MILTKLGTSTFLRDYWQQRPVLLRQAFPAFADPVSPEELAGLACEEQVESRLVFTRKNTWDLKQGPFKVRDFTSLPKRNWTLLVQAVDHWVPGVKALLEAVPFLPTWRVDDVMISYATPNGGVGPHFDYYDVFLVQGQGERIWKTGQRCTARDELRTDSGLKLLKRFDTGQEWHLKSGDVLYVPPGIAHWGVSVDDSLCYSIGFRAPSIGDMLLGYSDELGARLSADQRFTDPKRKQPLRAGEIGAHDLRRARQLLQSVLSDDETLAHWFGALMTQPRFPDLIQPLNKSRRLRANTIVKLNPGSRLAWQIEDKHVRVFADGESEQLLNSATLQQSLQALCSGRPLAMATLLKHKVTAGLCQRLLQQGTLLEE